MTRRRYRGEVSEFVRRITNCGVVEDFSRVRGHSGESCEGCQVYGDNDGRIGACAEVSDVVVRGETDIGDGTFSRVHRDGADAIHC